MATQLEQFQPALDKLAKSHVCSQCQPSKFYGSLDALRRHRKTHHSGTKPSWQCPECNQKPFPRKDHLTRHIKEKHTGEHLGECELCLRTFSNRYLKDHMETCKARSFGQVTEPPLKKTARENAARILEQAPGLKFVRGYVAPTFRRKKVVLSDNHEARTASSSSTRRQRVVGNALEPLKLNDEQQEEIFEAIRADDVALFTKIISSYGGSQDTLLSVDEAYSHIDGSLLHCAAAEGSIQVAQLLLSAGCDVNPGNKSLETPLHRAACFVKTEMVKFLVGQGADLDTKDANGQTALFTACWNEYETSEEADILQVVDVLLQRGASIDVEDIWNVTALCAAATKGIHLVVKRLLDGGASVNGFSTEGSSTPLMRACFHSAPGIVHTLLEHGADVNRCRLCLGHPKAMDPWERGFELEADVNPEQNHSRWTALAYACGPGITVGEMEDMSSRLLAAGADPNLGDVVPLETAIIFGYPSVIKILLDAGADPSRVSDECIETLRGVQKRTKRYVYRKRKEKWSLLQQRYPDMFRDREYCDSDSERGRGRMVRSRRAETDRNDEQYVTTTASYSTDLLQFLEQASLALAHI